MSVDSYFLCVTKIILFIYIDNKTWSIRFGTGLPIQVLTNSIMSVDTYLFQGGFLLAYLYLKNTDKDRSKPINYRAKLNEFFVYVIRRFIRYVFHVIFICVNN